MLFLIIVHQRVSPDKIWRNRQFHFCRPILQNYSQWLLSGLLLQALPSVLSSPVPLFRFYLRAPSPSPLRLLRRLDVNLIINQTSWLDQLSKQLPLSSGSNSFALEWQPSSSWRIYQFSFVDKFYILICGMREKTVFLRNFTFCKVL